MNQESNKDKSRFVQTEQGLGKAPTTPADTNNQSVDLRAVQNALDDIHGANVLLGKVLNGLYELQTLIGEGGMGAVYAAKHVHLQKEYAVKIIRSGANASPAALERFRQEAVAASRIDHPHIIDVVNFDITADGIVFLVMELLKGEDLATAIARGALPADRALNLIYQIGDALGAAHSQGIIHRDLKPVNIFLVDKENEEFVKILDFGISKMRADGEEQVRITRTGQVLGTPRYIAPEQAFGDEEVDHRADIYALGAMLYEMLCGVPPFEGRNVAQLLWQHTNVMPVPPSQRGNKAIPKGVEKVVMRALAKHPDQRFDSAEAMIKALRIAAGEVTSSADTVSGLRSEDSNKRITRYLVVVPVVLALAGGFLFWWGKGDKEVRQLSSSPTEQTPTQTEAPSTLDTEVKRKSIASEEQTAIQRPEEAAQDRVKMRFASDPPGASVWIEGEMLGRTPIETTVAITEDKVRVRFEARGYMAQTLLIRPSDGEQIKADLKRLPKRSSPSTKLPIKRQL